MKYIILLIVTLLFINNILSLNIKQTNKISNNIQHVSNVENQNQKNSYLELNSKIYATDTTPTPTASSSGVIINIPEVQDPITRNLKLYLIIIACCVGLCAICAFCYFCADRLLPVLAFLEHFIFYTVKLILLPYQCFIISLKFVCYPVKEIFFKCTNCCNNHYRPWSRTT